VQRVVLNGWAASGVIVTCPGVRISAPIGPIWITRLTSGIRELSSSWPTLRY
jgi:hypothetical protein